MGKKILFLFNGDGVALTQFFTGMAPMTLIFVYRCGFVVDQLIYFAWTTLYTFTTTSTFFFINSESPHPLLSWPESPFASSWENYEAGGRQE